MAFIREYAALSGDPFSLRMPKWLKRIKPGKLILQAARSALHNVPIVGQVVSAADTIRATVAPIVHPAAAAFIPAGPSAPPTVVVPSGGTTLRNVNPRGAYGESGDPWMNGFARAYGWNMGDPSDKGQLANSGTSPRAKAAKKAQVRSTKVAAHAAGTTTVKPAGKAAPVVVGPNIAGAIGGFLQGQGGTAAAIANWMATHGAAAAAGAAGAGGSIAHRHVDSWPVKPRRGMNPLNVRALRRSLRRVEGFQRVEKRVHKMLAPVARGASRSSGPRASRSRGHRPGCRCVVCSRA